MHLKLSLAKILSLFWPNIQLLLPQLVLYCQNFFKWPNPGLFFLYFRLFNTVDRKCLIYIFADDWIQTTDLWSQKRLLYQLSHNHSPSVRNFKHNFALQLCVSKTINNLQVAWYLSSQSNCLKGTCYWSHVLVHWTTQTLWHECCSGMKKVAGARAIVKSDH